MIKPSFGPLLKRQTHQDDPKAAEVTPFCLLGWQIQCDQIWVFSPIGPLLKVHCDLSNIKVVSNMS